jgi:hypothetical protein
MKKIRKHIDVVSNEEIFNENLNNGLYIEPWVVYIGNEENGYSIVYSKNQNKTEHIDPNIVEVINGRLLKLEDESIKKIEFLNQELRNIKISDLDKDNKITINLDDMIIDGGYYAEDENNKEELPSA